MLVAWLTVMLLFSLNNASGYAGFSASEEVPWQRPKAGPQAAHIFFFTSTCASRRSYSFLIFAFSLSSSCSFSMLNSCAATRTLNHQPHHDLCKDSQAWCCQHRRHACGAVLLSCQATKPCLSTAFPFSLQSVPSTEAQQGCDLGACIGTSTVHCGPVSGIPTLETCGAYSMCSVIGS